VLTELAQYFNIMDRIYLKNLIKEVIREFEVSDDDIEIEDNDPASFEGTMDQVGIDRSSIEVEGLTSSWRGLDLSEVSIVYAKWNDGTELTDEELEQLNYVDEFIILAQEKAIEDYYL
jgi:hypothetical protein